MLAKIILTCFLVTGSSTLSISDCKLGEELSDSATSCVQCNGGYYRSSTMSECGLCEENKIAPYSSGVYRDKCLECSAGAVADTTRRQCLQCDEGTYRSDNMAVCTVCAEENTEPNSQQSDCVAIPRCEEVRTPKGLVYPGGTQLRGSVVRVTCLAGFYLVRGTGTLTCQGTGVWSDTPICNFVGVCTDGQTDRQTDRHTDRQTDYMRHLFIATQVQALRYQNFREFRYL
ncbi:hypothetical protein ACHWQZ_G006704 [Mnemiopsis leidyi]